MCHGMQETMVDPGIAADGHTYERSAIQSWLKQHSTSPVTQQPLLHTYVFPNRIIRNLMICNKMQADDK